MAEKFTIFSVNYSKQNSESVAVRARADEVEGQRRAHEDHIMTLKVSHYCLQGFSHFLNIEI